MADHSLSWRYAEDFAEEPGPIAAARAHALEHGVEPVSPGTGAQLAVLAAACRAEQIAEIGTGLGVSGLWLLRGAPQATLTSIDVEPEYHDAARTLFTEAGHPAARVRLISGKAREVLPRMNDASYDLVLVDGDPDEVIADVEHALRLVRAGGVVAVAHALWRGRVADPAQRDTQVTEFRELLAASREAANATVALSVSGDGLLQLVTR